MWQCSSIWDHCSQVTIPRVFLDSTNYCEDCQKLSRVLATCDSAPLPLYKAALKVPLDAFVSSLKATDPKLEGSKPNTLTYIFPLTIRMMKTHHLSRGSMLRGTGESNIRLTLSACSSTGLNPSTWEAKAGASLWIWGQPNLDVRFMPARATK